MREDVTIETADGSARAFFFTPDAGKGPWPGVIFYMDGLAIRPALLAMGQRLADAGYAVLLPDMFWRAGPYDPVDVAQVFATGSVRATLGHLFASITPRTQSNTYWSMRKAK